MRPQTPKQKFLLSLTSGLLVLTLGGCQSLGTSQNQPSGIYAYQASPASEGPSLNELIAFKEERLKARPKAFLEQAELASLYLQKAKNLRQEPDLAKAQTWMKSSLDELENTSALMVKADLLQMEHKFEESHQVLDRILELEPGNLAAIVLKTRVFLAQGKAKDAETLLSSTREQPLFSLLFLRGMVAEDNGDIEKARQYYGDALAREKELGSASESARLRAVWARMELQEQRFDTAKALLQSAAEIPNKTPLVALLQAEVLRKEKRGLEATKELREGFALFQDPVFLLRIGEIQSDLGKSTEARESFEAAETLLRQDSFGHERDLALALFYLDPEGNRQEYSELLERELQRRTDRDTLEIAELLKVGVQD